MKNTKAIKTEIEFVLISCCTCKRPHMLSVALQSVDELNLFENTKVELLVVDNDENESARTVVENFSQISKIPVHYVCEKQRGIAFARNRVLKEALDLNASHIAFFDDDEILDKDWIINHIKFYKTNNNVIISSGPTYSKFENEYPSYIRNNKIFKTSTTKKTGVIRRICASGNVFFPVSMVTDSDLWFDNKFVFMGGEDGDFFARASEAGYTIVWNNDAVNYEIIGDQRANMHWILNRYYYNGYSGALLRFKNNKNWFEKVVYLFKTIISFLFMALVTVPSVILGIAFFWNTVGMAAKNLGKIVSTVRGVPLDYYKDVNGN